jgi:recombination protein RecA
MVLEQYVGPSHKFTQEPKRSFDLTGLAGKVVEFSGWNQSACLSLTIPLILECQSGNKECAWILPSSEHGGSLFFPPDFAEAGIACSRIPIVRSKNAQDSFAIAEKLVRSGGFGLVVLDLTEGKRVRASTIGRINSMTQRFKTLALCLTRNPPGHPSLDPMISIHIHISVFAAPGRNCTVKATVQKDKTQAPGLNMKWLYETPIGLC